MGEQMLQINTYDASGASGGPRNRSKHELTHGTKGLRRTSNPTKDLGLSKPITQTVEDSL